jgi:hypothetical protein
VERRSASANTAETQAFMNGEKRLLVFSEAGGTGRSYHADRNAKNQARRVHYLLEAGWKADTAVQGLGRTHRSNQASAPLFRPVTTTVKAERRFISTIARRLDSLGALTRGAARTGGQNLFRPEDNLESRFAKAALRSLYAAIANGSAQSITLDAFTEKTGLELVAEDGALLDELPPITRFLNRLLALRIADQDAIFEEFMTIIEGRMEAAAAAGQLHGGVETLHADRIVVRDRTVLRTCPATGSETLVWRLGVEKRIERLSADAMRRRLDGDGAMVRNSRSGQVAFRTEWASYYDDDGAIERQVRLVRPRGREVMKLVDLMRGYWEPCGQAAFDRLWNEAVDALPETETEEIALVSGLILPIWKHLPSEAPMIRRLTTACGQNLIGRIVPVDRLQAVAGALAPIDTRDPRRIAAGRHDRGPHGRADPWRPAAAARCRRPSAAGDRERPRRDDARAESGRGLCRDHPVSRPLLRPDDERPEGRACRDPDEGAGVAAAARARLIRRRRRIRRPRPTPFNPSSPPRRPARRANATCKETSDERQFPRTRAPRRAPPRRPSPRRRTLRPQVRRLLRDVRRRLRRRHADAAGRDRHRAQARYPPAHGRGALENRSRRARASR